MWTFPRASFAQLNLPAPEVVPTLETLNVREVMHPEDRPAGVDCLETPVQRLGIRGGLRRPPNSGTFPAAVAGRMRAGRQTAGDGGGRSRAALSCAKRSDRRSTI